MIKCTMAESCSKGKTCCCCQCEEKESCNDICDSLENIANCGYAERDQGDALVTMKQEAAAVIKSIKNEIKKLEANLTLQKKMIEDQEKIMWQQLQAAMEDTSENVIEESMKSGEIEKDSKPETPVEVKIIDSTGIETDEMDPDTEGLETSETEKNQEPSVDGKEESEDVNCSCSEPCSRACHSCCDYDDDCVLDEDDLDESTFDGKKAAKFVIGAACLIGAIIAVKVLKRKN